MNENMQVQQWMTSDPITVDDTNTLSTAFHLMKINKIRRLPVLDRDDLLVGIVTWGDIREGKAKRSPAMTLEQIWESQALAAIRDISEFMTFEPITIDATESIRRAADLMLINKIGGLPVMDGDTLVGMITESDIFRFLLDYLPTSSEMNKQPCVLKPAPVDV